MPPAAASSSSDVTTPTIIPDVIALPDVTAATFISNSIIAADIHHVRPTGYYMSSTRVNENLVYSWAVWNDAALTYSCASCSGLWKLWRVDQNQQVQMAFRDQTPVVKVATHVIQRTSFPHDVIQWQCPDCKIVWTRDSSVYD